MIMILVRQISKNLLHIQLAEVLIDMALARTRRGKISDP